MQVGLTRKKRVLTTSIVLWVVGLTLIGERTRDERQLEEMESDDGKRRPKAYTLSWKLNPSQVENISHGKSQSPTLF